MRVQLTIKPRDTLSDGRVNIYLVLRDKQEKKPKLFSTGKRIFPDHWDASARQLTPQAPNALLVNNYLREQLQRLESIILIRQQQGLPLTYQHVLDEYMGKNAGGNDFVVHYMQQKVAGLQAQVAPKTYQDYHFGISQIAQYSTRVRFSDITSDWLRSYQAYQSQRGRKPNGIFRDFSVLRKFWNLARSEGIVKHYPFADFKLPKEETLREFLQPDELDALHAFFFERGDSLPVGPHKTLGFYLFSCYTGLTKDDLQKRLDWQWLPNHLVIRRGKTRRTGKLTTIPLIERARALIPHVQTHTIKQSKARVGEDLRLIAARAGINKHLTYHTARHTFAINSLMRGVNIKVIQKILGHSTVRTTEVYLRIVDEYVDQEMMKWDT